MLQISSKVFLCLWSPPLPSQAFRSTEYLSSRLNAARILSFNLIPLFYVQNVAVYKRINVTDHLECSGLV